MQKNTRASGRVGAGHSPTESSENSSRRGLSTCTAGSSCTHHWLLVGWAWDGHSAAGVGSLLGHLHIHLPVVFGDKAVVKVIVLDLEENGLPVDVVPALQEVHGFGGDEHAVAVDVLHGYEAAWGERRMCDAELLCFWTRPSLDAHRGSGLPRLGSEA